MFLSNIWRCLEAATEVSDAAFGRIELVDFIPSVPADHTGWGGLPGKVAAP